VVIVAQPYCTRRDFEVPLLLRVNERRGVVRIAMVLEQWCSFRGALLPSELSKLCLELMLEVVQSGGPGSASAILGLHVW
jgi:hypothetical protein